VLAVYGLANLAYLYALPFNEVCDHQTQLAYGNAPPVATKAVQTFLGTLGTKFVVGCFPSSRQWGACTVVILVKARIPFGDGARLDCSSRELVSVSSGARVPVWAIGMNAVVGQCAGGYRNL